MLMLLPMLATNPNESATALPLMHLLLVGEVAGLALELLLHTGGGVAHPTHHPQHPPSRSEVGNQCNTPPLHRF